MTNPWMPFHAVGTAFATRAVIDTIIKKQSRKVVISSYYTARARALSMANKEWR